MFNLNLPECPYCGKRTSFVKTNAIKKNSTHCCKNCGKSSNVIFAPFIYTLAAIVIGLSSIVVSVHSVLGIQKSPIALFLVLIFFICFYLLTPFLMKLYPTKERRS